MGDLVEGGGSGDEGRGGSSGVEGRGGSAKMALVKGLVRQGVMGWQGGQAGALSIKHRTDAGEDAYLGWREEIALIHGVDGLWCQVEGHRRQSLRHHSVWGHNWRLEF